MTDPSSSENNAKGPEGRSTSPWEAPHSSGQPRQPEQPGQPGQPRQPQPSASQRPSADRPNRPGAPQKGSRGAATSAADSPRKTLGKGKAAQGQATTTSSGKPGKQQDWGLFRAVVALYGLVIIAYGVWQIFAGTASLPGESTGSSATVAASYGALAAVLCGVGAAFVAIAVKFKWANVLWFVCLMIFLGGVGRIFSWAIFGLPHPLMIVLMVLDLVIPPCLLVWHAWIRKANRIRSEMTQGGTQPAESKKAGKKRS